jgi:hypothetical protein
MSETGIRPGLKRKEFKPCLVCEETVFHGRDIHFYVAGIEQHIADLPAIQRSQGLVQMMNGHEAIAAALSPNEDLSHGMGETRGLLCAECAMTTPIAMLAQIVNEREEKASALKANGGGA